ncbi:hypothetical protein B0H19DRAFT_1076072 [Mycena capillaripes]|nr:hypothetical protein B0H19DRAFT_1076072 [Mycena capillaripes]
MRECVWTFGLGLDVGLKNRRGHPSNTAFRNTEIAAGTFKPRPSVSRFGIPLFSLLPSSNLLNRAKSLNLPSKNRRFFFSPRPSFLLTHPLPIPACRRFLSTSSKSDSPSPLPLAVVHHLRWSSSLIITARIIIAGHCPSSSLSSFLIFLARRRRPPSSLAAVVARHFRPSFESFTVSTILPAIASGPQDLSERLLKPPQDSTRLKAQDLSGRLFKTPQVQNLSGKLLKTRGASRSRPQWDTAQERFKAKPSVGHCSKAPRGQDLSGILLKTPQVQNLSGILLKALQDLDNRFKIAGPQDSRGWNARALRDLTRLFDRDSSFHIHLISLEYLPQFKWMKMQGFWSYSTKSDYTNIIQGMHRIDHTNFYGQIYNEVHLLGFDLSIWIVATELWKEALAFARRELTPPASQTRPKPPVFDRLMPVPSTVPLAFHILVCFQVRPGFRSLDHNCIQGNCLTSILAKIQAVALKDFRRPTTTWSTFTCPSSYCAVLRSAVAVAIASSKNEELVLNVASIIDLTFVHEPPLIDSKQLIFKFHGSFDAVGLTDCRVVSEFLHYGSSMHWEHWDDS